MVHERTANSLPKIGISAVAKEAGVSEATVSRVLNNPAIVAPDTRRAVEVAMRSVGYAKNNPANLVMIVTPGLSDALFAQLCERLAASLGPHGMRAVICSAPLGSVQEFDYVTALADAGAIGAVFASASNTLEDADLQVPRLLQARGIPFICINGSFPGLHAPAISADDILAAELSVDHLWTLGHRRIGLIAGPIGNRPSDLRARGFLQAMRQRGSDITADSIIRHVYSIEGGVAAASALIAEKSPTAIIAASDEMALGAIRAIRRSGKRVPEDISVVGYDDALPLEFTDPPLTTVRQPLDRLAQAAVSLLTRLIRQQAPSRGELLFEPELIIRSSTAPISQ